MSRSVLDQIEWGLTTLERPAIPPPPELVQWTKRVYGFWPSQFEIFAPCPWLVEAILDSAGQELAHISRKLADMISLVVSQNNSCRFCYGTCRTMLKLKGFSEAQIHKLETDLDLAEITPEERLALDYVRKLARGNPRPGASEARVLREAGYTPEAIAEMTLCAAFTQMVNCFATLTALQPSSFENLEGRWYSAFLKPLFFRKAGRHRRRIPPRSLPAGRKEVPGAVLIEALDGVPGAANLCRILNYAWQSPHLPGRTKAMIAAVIGYSLGCPAARREVLPVLEAERISAADLEEIVLHLASPKMNPLEARLVPLARETVRYHPAYIQERIRELNNGLKPEQILDAVGFFGIANAFCRLSVVLECC